MNGLTLLARLVLGGTFIAAGTAKLSAPGRMAFERALRDFGVSAALAPPIAAVLPWVEVGSGALLVVGLGARLAALVVLTLLVAFSVVIARAVARQDDVDCGCFGAASGRPVGPRTLARNAGLAVLAVLAAREGAWSAQWGPRDRWLPVLLVAAGVLAAAAVVSHLHRLSSSPQQRGGLF